ncbi:hypothetical protein P3B99_001680 [Opitutia bacterium KCR 482]|nr:hypothetical protein [Opitutae bacterium KCR 482]
MKNSKIPLYIADALLVLLALTVALRQGANLGAAQALLCCLAVFAGMALALAPYVLEYKLEASKRFEHTQEARKNFEIVFDDLASLRLALAELVERVENGEEKLSDLPALQKGLVDLRDAAKRKFGEIADSADDLAARVSKAESERKAQKTALEEIGADMVVIKELFSASQESDGDEFAQIRAQITELKDEILKLREAQIKHRSTVEPQKLSAPEPDTATTEEPQSATTEEPQSATTEDGEGKAGNSVEDGATQSAEAAEANAEFSPAKILAGGLLKRALEHAEDTKASVEKFVNMGAKKDATSPSDAESFEEPFDQDGEKLGSFADEAPASPELTNAEAQAISSGAETPPAPAAPQTAPISEKAPEIEAATDSPEDADEDFFERADSPLKVESAQKPQQETPPAPPPADTQSAEAAKNSENLLFDDLPISRESPVKPKKGDAVVVVNALIGIGNKPFLRGNGAGLSPVRGTPMDYLEIGKWRYVFPAFDGKINFSVLKNDEVPPNGESEFSISAGEKTELNLFFPLEQI